ncbi:hypothetical protein MHY85_12575 [Cellulomonas sp. ACRRI]|uniref:hypothetical protein n=1 Tax=Cellulomonas sp. ACRRI TaxID=2918188 RepID=UPI001EF39269|nr:hypothetical protein [Cellulomonas sp. ACRRI]MCG7286804.1 hypothetical protein [Cellulomonas sp. ACRRI]
MITRDRDRTPWARVSRVLPLDAERAWDLVADARHHTRWVPLTRVDLNRPSPRAAGPRPTGRTSPEVGDEIRAVTGPTARRGGPGLVDRMRIDRYERPLGAVPGVAVFQKLGPVLLGTARIEVAAAGASARVTWSESVHLRGLPPAATRWLGALLVDGMLRLVLDRAAREAAAGTQRTAA